MLNKIVAGVLVVLLVVVGVGIHNIFVNHNTTPEVVVVPNNAEVPVIENNITVQKSVLGTRTQELNLSGNRFVYISGAIDELNSMQVAKQVLELGKSSEPMTLIINSPGGSVLDGAQIISAMEAARGPVNTLCVSICASMAAMIHQYGTHRLMINRSILMFHPAAGGVEGTLDQQNSRLTLFRNFVSKMEQNVAKRSGTTLAEYKTRSLVELWLDAEDAFAQHYADQIVFVRGSDARKVYSTGFDDRVEKKVQTVPQKRNTEIPQLPHLDWF